MYVLFFLQLDHIILQLDQLQKLKMYTILILYFFSLFLYFKVIYIRLFFSLISSICFYYFRFFNVHKPNKYVANVNFLLKNTKKFA